VAVDIAKSVFDLAGSDERGRVTFRRRLSRGAFLTHLAQLPASTVVMEAYGSAQFWAQQISRSWVTPVVLLPPHQVRPYVTRNKTDRTDAKGTLEAYRNADIRPAPVKTVAQQVLCSLHRLSRELDRGAHGSGQHTARVAARAGPGDPARPGESSARE
jgi:transposase